VTKLNEAEESLLIYQQDIKKLQSKVLTLRTHIEQITKWKEHVKGMGVTSELRRSSNEPEVSSSRERAHEYSKRQAARKIIQEGGPLPKKTTKGRKDGSRPSSRPPSRPRSRTASSTSIKSSNPFDQHAYLQKLLEAVASPRKSAMKTSQHYQPMYPAQQILLSKLKDVDGDINELARDLMIY
jgi:hypothetical protein